MSERFKARREQLGLSQAHVARHMGVSVNALQKIENGTTKDPRGHTLNGAAHALGVSVDWLLYGEGEPSVADPGFEEFVDRIHASMPDLPRDTVREIQMRLLNLPLELRDAYAREFKSRSDHRAGRKSRAAKEASNITRVHERDGNALRN